MFSELRHELEEEAVAGDDDPETHYNMGVAFREMGLIDEAIAELQRYVPRSIADTHSRKAFRLTPGWRSASSTRECRMQPFAGTKKL